eukprot:3388455-Lingulodinium_polyedra.AAC.1
MLQETKLPAAALPGFTARAREHGWACSWVPATRGPGGRPTAGLGCLVKAPRALSAQPVPHEGDEAIAGRLQHVVIQRGGSGVLHVLNVYGHDVSQPEAGERNRKLFETLFE